VIFSSIYESFPFHFSKAISYDCHIFANEIPANSEVMWEHISYLDPLSIHNMKDTITDYIKTPKLINYGEIDDKFSPQISSQELSRIILEEK